MPREGFEPPVLGLKVQSIDHCANGAVACIRSGCLFSIVPPFLSPTVELPASVIAGWPPRSRTERYRLIGAAPSTGWVVASRWRRSRPPARPRPSGFKPEAATRQLHHPGAEDGGPDPLRSPAHPTSNRGPPPWRFHLPRPPDASEREVAEDGDPDSQRRAAPIRFPSGAGLLAGSSSKRGRRAT